MQPFSPGLHLLPITGMFDAEPGSAPCGVGLLAGLPMGVGVGAGDGAGVDAVGMVDGVVGTPVHHVVYGPAMNGESRFGAHC